MKNMLNPSEQDARGIARKLRVNWEKASASESKRTAVDAENVRNAVWKVADEVARHCEVSQAFNTAPNLPIVCASMLQSKWI